MTNLVRKSSYILIGTVLILVNVACETNRGFRATRLDRPPIGEKPAGEGGQVQPGGTQLPPPGDPTAPVEVERGVPSEQAMEDARQEAIETIQEQAPQLSEEQQQEMVDKPQPDSVFAKMAEEIRALDAIRLIGTSGQVSIALVGVIDNGQGFDPFFLSRAVMPAEAVNQLRTEVVMEYVPYFPKQKSISAGELVNLFGYEFSVQCTQANCDEFQIKARLSATGSQPAGSVSVEAPVFTFAPIAESPTGFFKITADTLSVLRKNNEMTPSLADYAMREGALHALFLDMESEVTAGLKSPSPNEQVVVKGARVKVTRGDQLDIQKVAELSVEMVLEVKGQPIHIKARSNMDWVRGLINQPQPDDKRSMQVVDAKTEEAIPGITMFFACDNDCGNIRLRMNVEETGSKKFFYFSNNGALTDGQLTLISSSDGSEGLDYDAAVQAFDQILLTQQQQQQQKQQQQQQRVHFLQHQVQFSRR